MMARACSKGLNFRENGYPNVLKRSFQKIWKMGQLVL
jgi:hypothetical protein